MTPIRTLSLQHLIRALMFGALLLFAALASAAGKSGYKVGDIPDNAMPKDQRGEALRFPELQGRVVIVSFWATWCPPCLKELPVLEKMQRAVPADELKVIAISIDSDRRDVKRAMPKIDELQMSVVHDTRMRLAKAFGVNVVPHLMLIDHEGRIAAIHKGYTEEKLDEYVDEVNALLQKRANANAGAAGDFNAES